MDTIQNTKYMKKKKKWAKKKSMETDLEIIQWLELASKNFNQPL